MCVWMIEALINAVFGSVAGRAVFWSVLGLCALAALIALAVGQL